MSKSPVDPAERLEAFAAWHRALAEQAGASWVWEARLRTAEDLELQTANLRAKRLVESGNQDEPSSIAHRIVHKKIPSQ
jgi:hypothetical protein